MQKNPEYGERQTLKVNSFDQYKFKLKIHLWMQINIPADSSFAVYFDPLYNSKNNTTRSFLELPPAFSKRANNIPLLLDAEPVKVLWAKYNVTPAQILLRWEKQR